jgi:hypothetical protein
MKGWYYESYRHSLAAKGIRTNWVLINENPSYKRIRINRGYKDVVQVDAKTLKERFEKDNNTPLAWKQLRFDLLKNCEEFDQYPEVDILSSGKIDFNDGRHRVAVAAARGETIEIAVKNKDKFLEAFSKHSFAAKQDPYEFQDSNQEKIVHADWWGEQQYDANHRPLPLLWKDNELRFVLEGSGDIFREFSIHKADNWWFAQNYIDEKAARIKKYLTDPSLANHSVGEINKAKLAEIRRLWTIQPYETELQKKAIDLNLAIIDKDNEKALSILKEVSKV